MSETCIYCGSEVSREHPSIIADTRCFFTCGSAFKNDGRTVQSITCRDRQIAALTQRLEQAEAKLRRYESAETADAKVMVAAFNKLTAAEFREKRLREGIEWLEVDIRTADSLGSVDKQDEWEKFCAALLAQPSDAKEAEGGK